VVISTPSIFVGNPLGISIKLHDEQYKTGTDMRNAVVLGNVGVLMIKRQTPVPTFFERVDLIHSLPSPTVTLVGYVSF
jgi:hypothetical protein